MKHAVKHLRFPEAAVETVAEFRQVAGQMLGADAMVDTPDIAFHIGDQGLNPGQDLRRLLPRTGYQPLMTETGRSIQAALALPAVSLDHRLGCQALPDQGLNLFAADSGNHTPGGKSGLIGRSFHGYHHLGLAGGATSSFAWFGATDIGIIQFDQTGQRVTGLALRHGLADLMPHDPHRFLGPGFQDSLQRQHGGATFLSAHEEDHPEPFPQGGPGLMKNRPGRQRSLVTTSFAGI